MLCPYASPSVRLSTPQHAASRCRTLSFSDACHSKNNYQYFFFQIAALDGDNKIIPVALAILTSQTIDDFVWVYEQLFTSSSVDFLAWLRSEDHAIFADRGDEGKAADRMLNGWRL
jgi:hypothetical protein